MGRVVDLLHLTRPSGETIGKVDMTDLSDLVGFPFLSITRHALQRVLLGHLPDGGIQLGSRLEGLETHEASGISELRFEGRPDVVRARAVVGADGRRCEVAIYLTRLVYMLLLNLFNTYACIYCKKNIPY